MFTPAVVVDHELTILRGTLQGEQVQQSFAVCYGAKVLAWLHNPTLTELREEFRGLGSKLELLADFGGDLEQVVLIEEDPIWGEVVFTKSEQGYTALVH